MVFVVFFESTENPFGQTEKIYKTFNFIFQKTAPRHQKKFCVCHLFTDKSDNLTAM